MVWEIMSRRFFDSPHAWAFDAQIQLYGTMFMMAGAYTLSKAGHIRGDVIYGFFPPRVQAGLDLTLYIFFFLPGTVALAYAGYIYAGESWAIRERSGIMAEGPFIYPFKTFIPIAGWLLLLQGFAEIARCVICLRTGEGSAAKLARSTRQAQGDGPREGRGHRRARRVRGEAGAREGGAGEGDEVVKMRKELWFGFTLMALIVIPTLWFMPLSHMTLGHYGLLMLSLVVVAIMLGFPTAFTLMGMGVIFTWIAYRLGPEWRCARRSTHGPAGLRGDEQRRAHRGAAFVFMGYLVERAT
jgi:TRAP-type mannitol/chloroaromatic compound transport system permease small subunit